MTLANVQEMTTDGSGRTIEREWVPEAPVALEFNGLSYAVMMATPNDLDDFARGFALTEGLAKHPREVEHITAVEVPKGFIVRTSLRGLGVEKLTERIRTRVAESSCGLCGIENLDAVARPLPEVRSHLELEPSAVFKATSDLRAQQALNRKTGAAHAAAFASSRGAIEFVREDVGRHNAVDKLVGALAHAGRDPGSGFFISSARCSYEIVEKVVRAGGTSLVTISLPTSLAVARAKDAGLTLCCLARSDSFLLVENGTIASPSDISAAVQ